MSDAASSPLLTYVHSQFREAFGQPSSMLEMDSQWSLRSEPRAPAIFILVNGSYEKPAVWIFDPYEADNVWRTSITTTTEVDDAISIIKARMVSAAAAWSANGQSDGKSDRQSDGKFDNKADGRADGRADGQA